MIVVSDTSPVNYLVLIELEHLLPALFGEIVLPTAVLEELCSAAAPQRIQEWLATTPRWVKVKAPLGATPELMGRDAGEREVITLARHLNASLVLLDEAKGRQKATEQGLAVAGTLGILDRAAGRGLVRLSEALYRLEQTSFRASPGLLRRFRDRG